MTPGSTRRARWKSSTRRPSRARPCCELEQGLRRVRYDRRDQRRRGPESTPGERIRHYRRVPLARREHGPRGDFEHRDDRLHPDCVSHRRPDQAVPAAPWPGAPLLLNPADDTYWFSKTEYVYQVNNQGQQLFKGFMGTGTKGYAVWWRAGGGAYATTGDPSSVVELDAAGRLSAPSEAKATLSRSWTSSRASGGWITGTTSSPTGSGTCETSPSPLGPPLPRLSSSPPPRQQDCLAVGQRDGAG